MSNPGLDTIEKQNSLILARSGKVNEVIDAINAIIQAEGVNGIEIIKASSGWKIGLKEDPEGGIPEGFEERVIVVQIENNDPVEWIGLFKDNE